MIIQIEKLLLFSVQLCMFSSFLNSHLLITLHQILNPILILKFYPFSQWLDSMVKPLQNIIDGKKYNLFSSDETDIFTLPPLGSLENKSPEVKFYGHFIFMRCFIYLLIRIHFFIMYSFIYF